MAFYPYGEVRLMEDYELAKAYSWDLPSALKLVKVEMHMKLQEFNDRILHAIGDINNYEKFHQTLFKKEEDKNVNEESAPGSEEGSCSEEGEGEGQDEGEEREKKGHKGQEVLDEMRDKEVDYLDLIMPNLSLKLPNIEQESQPKKVQFSVGRKAVSHSDDRSTVISCFLHENMVCGFLLHSVSLTHDQYLTFGIRFDDYRMFEFVCLFMQLHGFAFIV